MTGVPEGIRETKPQLIGPDDPNAWIRERREEFLGEPNWRTTDIIQLAFMIDHAGKRLMPFDIRNQLDPTLGDSNKRGLFTKFKKELVTHEVLGPELGERGHGPGKRYWLGKLVVVEDVEPGESAIAQIAEVEVASVNPAEIAETLSQAELERLVENSVLGEPLAENLFGIIPKTYFKDFGKVINNGLQAALHNKAYAGSPTAADNFRRIKAELNRYPWETRTRI